ncbi:MAG: AzlD domain-containing protein [Rhodospirillales bacterium]|nr:AzlD domain-containing protein [Rhodospirillales bacterium]
MAETLSPLWPWIVCLAAAAATYFWRGLGVALSGRIRPTDPIFEWISCVAYALLSGLVARMIVLPVGPLENADAPVRIGAALFSLVVYFIFKRNLVAGILVGPVALAILVW